MGSLERLPYLRTCVDADDTFLYDVFCTTWESEVAALPNPKLAQHVLRIQHIAQERRFRTRYPHHERYVVLEDDEPAGRLYVDRNETMMHVVDLTLLPRFQSQGIGTRVFQDLFHVAGEDRQVVTLRVPRRNVRATDLYTSLGFRLVSMDDLDSYFEWTPATVAAPEDMKEGNAAVEEGPEAMKEGPSAMKEGHVAARSDRH
jgi:ribosomal protein S18 acetylase RimI-like enzyme